MFGNMSEKKEEKSNRYILYTSEFGERKQEFGWNSFKQKYIQGSGNYLPHLESVGKMKFWYQIVDTSGVKNKVCSERYGRNIF